MDDPKQAAQQIVNRVKLRPVPFHQFRNILKTPSWYVAVMDGVEMLDPSIELLSTPAFSNYIKFIWKIIQMPHPERLVFAKTEI